MAAFAFFIFKNFGNVLIGLAVEICSFEHKTSLDMDLNKNSPEKTLIIYGTLAPDAPNHHVISHIRGRWARGIVRGKLVQQGWGADLGYFGFRHAPAEEQVEIPAFVLFSEELEANWAFLDEFEGDGYRRVFAEFELENGEVGTGFIYAIND